MRIEQRAPMLLVVGVALVYLGLASLELAPLPFSGRTPHGGSAPGCRAASSVVTMPCASPLLAAVRAAAGALLLVIGAGFVLARVAWF